MVVPTKRLDVDGITTGELITTGNTDLNQIVPAGTGSATAEITAALRGLQGIRVTGVATDTYAMHYTDTAAASASAQVYFRSNATPTVNNEFFGIRSTGNMGRIVETTTGTLVLQDGGGATINWTQGTFTRVIGTKYRCQVQVTKGTTTTNGMVSGQIYDDSDTLLRSGTSSTANAGTTDASSARHGKVNSASAGVDMDLDEFAFITGTTAEIDPAPLNTPPRAGLDQVVDPFARVDLIGIDAQSTPVWSQVSGSPTVTLEGSGANRWFFAPATRSGTTLQFMVTDDQGLTDTMNVVVYQHNEWALVGDVVVPLRLKSS